MPATSKVIRACLLYEFKLGTKVAQVARNIGKAFRENTVSDYTHKTLKSSKDSKSFFW